MELISRKPGIGYLDTSLWVPKSVINLEGTKRVLTFQVFDQKSASELVLYKETEHHLLVPREFWKPEDFDFPVIDCRPLRFPLVDIRSKVVLDHRFEKGVLVPTGETVQQEAMSALLRSRGGILQLACGKGKSVVALDYIARRKVPAIVILDTTQLIQQWREEIELFLDVPGGVGLIQGAVCDWQHPIVLATYHTMAAVAATLPDEIRRWFGTAIWDEAHHVSAPTFSKSADLFYGVRLGLTATPERPDGSHVVYNFHLGPVIHKNLEHAFKPKFYFIWTGYSLDKSDPKAAEVNDCSGQLHLGLLAGFLAKQPGRVDFVLDEVRQQTAVGKKVIVLSKSKDALINMLAAWNKQASLITDIPFPEPKEVGEKGIAIDVTPEDVIRLTTLLEQTNQVLLVSPSQTEQLRKTQIEEVLEGHRVFKKCESLWNKKRDAYLKLLLGQPSTAGLMIYKVDPETRMRMLREKQVTFAIAKYGREGLNEQRLDVVILNEPLSARNSLQQLMGRVQRKKDGVVIILEDNIGPCIGMCQKLRSYLREWPHNEGGPYSYENVERHNKRNDTWKIKTATGSPRAPIKVPGS